jgi:hypothetical protein
LKSEQQVFLSKILFVLENFQNQIIEIIEVFEKETIEHCHLINDCLRWHLKGNFAL